MRMSWTISQEVEIEKRCNSSRSTSTSEFPSLPSFSEENTESMNRHRDQRSVNKVGPPPIQECHLKSFKASSSLKISASFAVSSNREPIRNAYNCRYSLSLPSVCPSIISITEESDVIRRLKKIF